MPTDLNQSPSTRSSLKDPATLERLSVFLWVAAAIVCAVFSVRIFLAAPQSSQDSWFAMSRAIEFMHGSSPGLVYETLMFSQHIKFQYPPSGLLLLELLNFLGVRGAENYNAINAVALIATGLVFSLFTVQVLGPIQYLGVRLPLAPIAFLVSIKFFPDRFAFEVGQIQVLLGLLFTLACLALWHGKRELAGLMIAIIATVKPQFVVFGLWALWRRDWKFVIAFAAIVFAAMVIAIAMYGWDAQFAYLKVLQFLSHHGECFHTNQSINGILNRELSDVPCVDSDPNSDPSSPVHSSWFPDYIPAVYFATLISSLIMIAAPFVLNIKSADRISMLLGFCTAAVLFTMASPIAWAHHYNILLPAYVMAFKVAIDSWRGTRRTFTFAVLAVSLLLTGLPLTPTYGPTVPALNLVQSHVFIGVCLLLGVLVVEMLVRRRTSQVLTP